MINEQDTNHSLLDILCAQIEVAWKDNRDHAIVDHLARNHPDMSFELYQFFSYLIEAEFTDQPTKAELDKLSSKIRQNAELNGYLDDSLDDELNLLEESNAPSEAGSYLDLIKLRTDKRPSQIAQSLGLTVVFLEEISQYPDIVPQKAKQELAQRAAQLFEINPSVSLDVLSRSSNLKMAASRDTSFERLPPTYADIVERSGMDNTTKAYWLSLA